MVRAAILCAIIALTLQSAGAGDWFFLQMSDPQFGMYTADRDFSQETANFEFAIAGANRLRPAFVVVCGDLINKAGDVAQSAEYLRIAGKLDRSIPLYSVAGNHDVGNQPTSESLALYRKKFGPDFYSFRHADFAGIVLDSSLIQHPEKVPDETEKQEQWLKAELEKLNRQGVRRIVVFQHIPFFLEKADEPDQYFNIPRETRKRYLNLLQRSSVQYVFAGHYHRNASGTDRSLRMITTGPVGKPIGPDPSGVRVVIARESGLEDQYYGLGNIPNQLELASPIAAVPAMGASQSTGELIFPLEHWHNHSSSIVELPNGDLLICWFHGSGERTADDVLIQAARWSKATGKWSEPFTLADTPGFPETNPTMFIDSRQRLFFLWPLIVAHQWETALMKYRISTDYQQVSGPPRWEHQDNIVLIPKNIAARTKEIMGNDAAATGTGRRAEYASKMIEHANNEYFSRMGWFTRTHPLQLPSGRILVPMYSDGFSFGIMAISDDGGYNWNASEPIIGYGCIQPSVVRKADGTLVAYLRDNGPPPKRAHISYSKDDGVTWTPAKDTEIPNPGSSLEAIRLRNGDWIMVYNDLDNGRYSLVAALSDDEGVTWKWKRHLDGNPAQPGKSQYHYPSVIQAKDGSIHVTYSYFVPEGKSIKHVRFGEEWVKASE